MIKEITNEQINEYIKTNGYYCPICKSDALRMTESFVKDGEMYNTIECLDCNSEWGETYTLTSIEILSRGDLK